MVQFKFRFELVFFFTKAVFSFQVTFFTVRTVLFLTTLHTHLFIKVTIFLKKILIFTGTQAVNKQILTRIDYVW